jgi:L,D-peptidoglycan transpeptidase YkuD (ErfK/YbiS/YcfS/YnhG family)
LLLLLLIAAAVASPIPETATQLLVGWSEGWDSSTATLQRYTRSADDWQPEGPTVPARLGREGLAWGSGLHEAQEGQQKQEGDWRSPAGVFAIGTALGDAVLSPAPDWPMSVVTERTLWVEDPGSPLYNQLHVVSDSRPLTAWETSQRMRMGDAAHRLKLVIQHNTDPPLSGAGSAIFFHIWRRDGTAPTAGCTAMPETELEELIRWLRPEAAPVLVLLPTDEHARLQTAWALPTLPL